MILLKIYAVNHQVFLRARCCESKNGRRVLVFYICHFSIVGNLRYCPHGYPYSIAMTCYCEVFLALSYVCHHFISRHGRQSERFWGVSSSSRSDLASKRSLESYAYLPQGLKYLRTPVVHYFCTFCWYHRGLWHQRSPPSSALIRILLWFRAFGIHSRSIATSYRHLSAPALT